MMIEPPIDDLTKEAGNNKYVLAVLASKRAKEIEAMHRTELAAADKKAISLALEEIYEGQVKPSQIND